MSKIVKLENFLYLISQQNLDVSNYLITSVVGIQQVANQKASGVKTSISRGPAFKLFKYNVHQHLKSIIGFKANTYVVNFTEVLDRVLNHTPMA